MRISDWSSDVCSSDLHHLKVLEQRREFFWIVRSAFEKVPASLVRLSHPPNDSVSINDSTSLDLRIEWVKLMMPEWNHLVGFQVIADEGSLTHNCTLTDGGQGFDIKHKNHFRLSNDCRGGRRCRSGSCRKSLCHLICSS